MKVELFTSVDGDWISIFCNEQKVYSGHSITAGMLLDLLVQVGVDLDVRREEFEDDAERYGQWLGN